MAAITPTGTVLARIGRALVPAIPTRTAAHRSMGAMSVQEINVAAFERVQEWTAQAAKAVRFNGTINNHLKNISSLARKATWEAIRRDGPVEALDEDYRATAFVESLTTLDIGRCVRRNEAVGAHWLIPWPDKDSLIRWDNASTSELRLPIDAGRPPEITRHSRIGFQPLYPRDLDPDKRPALIRVWRPDDEWGDEAWSPVATILQHVEALHLMNLAEMALDRNRLASAGILFLPNDIVGIDKGDASSPTFAKITKAATTAIADPNSVSSVVPVFLTGPGSSGEQIRHLITERREDPAAFQARREAHLRAIADGLSAPAGKILGTEDQAKYANAAAMDFETLRTYLPSVTDDTVRAVNAVYREVRQQWGMPTRGYELRLNFEELKPKENRTNEAIQLREIGQITSDGLAEMAQIPEEWRLKPGTPDYQRWEAEQKQKAARQPVPVADPGAIVHAPNGKPPEGVAVPKAAARPPLTLAELDAALGIQVSGPVAALVVAHGAASTVEPSGHATSFPSGGSTGGTELERISAALGLPPVRTASMTPTDREILCAVGDAALRSDEAINLADVVIGGNRIFEGLGLDRKDMPQLDDGALEAFLSALTADSVDVAASEHVDPTTLLASQSQLSARKARLMSFAEELDELLAEPIVVSADRYVLDGHHRWVAAIMADKPLNVIRVDLSITDLLERASEFAGDAKHFTAAVTDATKIERGNPALAAHTSAAGTTPDWASILAALADIDRRLHDRIAAAAEHAMETALRKAGNKAANKATASAKRTIADVERRRVVATLGRRVVAALGLDEDELLAGAIDDLLPIIEGYMADAQNDAVRVLQRAEPTLVFTIAAAEWRQAAVETFREGFLAAARDALHDPDPHFDPRGELPALETKVPIRVISDTVARAGGVEPAGPDQVLIGGPGQGSVLRSTVASVDQPPRLVYVWHHGFHGSPARSFPAHAALDGQRWASMDDPTLVKNPADPDAWTGGTTWHVGDHRGCTCAVVLQIDDGGTP